MSDNKPEGVGVAVQPEYSRAVNADGEGNPVSATAKESLRTVTKESLPAATDSNPADESTEIAKEKKANTDADRGVQVDKEKAARADGPEQSLGTFLIAAREGRGLTADDVVHETRLPPHYLRMMETNDYSEISDQLYLLPFLRRYATFLELDQEDVAMRFVREVQRADGNPGPPRLDQPLVAEPRQHRGWTGAIVVVGLLLMAISVYVYESNRHRQISTDTMMPHASAGIANSSNGATDSTAPSPAQ